MNYRPSLPATGTTGSTRRTAATFALTLAALLGGCVTYSQSQLSAMSSVDICEMQHMQAPNLSPETKQVIASELQRRKDNCGNHAAEVAERYAAFMYRETYGKHDNP